MNQLGKTQGEKMYEAAMRQLTWDAWFRRMKWLLCAMMIVALLKYLFS